MQQDQDDVYSVMIYGNVIARVHSRHLNIGRPAPADNWFKPNCKRELRVIWAINPQMILITVPRMVEG